MLRLPDVPGLMTVKIGTPIADVERERIMATLRHCDGDKARAAELLGVSLKTLYNRLGAYRASEANAAAGKQAEVSKLPEAEAI